MNVVIFGGGISGLTVAHELLNLGFNVTIYEKKSKMGGMAISERDSDKMPTEHSWRGYAPFYQNVFNLLKHIPYNNKSVYEELSEPLNFILPKDDIKKRENLMPNFNIKDYLILFYYALKVFTSNLRNKEYAKINYLTINKYLTEEGQDKTMGMLGPGLGFDKYKASLYHSFKFIELQLPSHTHIHHELKHKVHRSFENWHAMKQPTSESWINPWINYLLKKGVKIRFNHNLVKINATYSDVISSCQVNNKIVKADYYVMATDPFSLQSIIERTPLLKKDINLNKFKGLIRRGTNDMISFRIAFNESIKFPTQTTAIALPDSEFNITFYPQERLFNKNVYLGKNIKGLWSGTACSCDYPPGKLFNLPANKLSKEQFIEEILHQIYRCKQLQNTVYKFNGKKLKDFNIIKVEVWNEWKFRPTYGRRPPGKAGPEGSNVQNDSLKWVNDTNTYAFRPSQTTKFKNLFLSGAHTKISVNIWSMEGAVESGKIVAREICKKNNINPNKIWLYTHKKLLLFKSISYIDDVLYMLGLPNIIDLILILLLLFVFKKNKII